MKQHIHFVINEQFDGSSIKELLKFFHIGRPTIEKLRVNKSCIVNDKVVTNLDIILKTDDILDIYHEEEITISPYDFDLDILYEDNNYLIINKPSGILIHDDGNNDKTLTNAVYNYYLKTGQNCIPRCGHRLDVETSGIIVFVKNFISGAMFDHELSNHNIYRKYSAFVQGKIEKKSDILNYRIGRDRHNSKKHRVSSTGVDAVTTYKLINNYKGFSHIELLLKTGRTHQIRVHMSHIKHPLLGDTLYGGSKDKINRVALHSTSLKFYDYIENKNIEVNCDLPLDMSSLIK